MSIHQISAGPFKRISEPVKIFFVFSFSLSCSAMMNIHFCSCNYDVGRTKLSTPLFYDWLFSSVLLLSCCAPNLLRLALFAIILPLLFPKLKSQHSASLILRTCWQPAATSRWFIYDGTHCAVVLDARLFAIIIVYPFFMRTERTVPREASRHTATLD